MHSLTLTLGGLAIRLLTAQPLSDVAEYAAFVTDADVLDQAEIILQFSEGEDASSAGGLLHPASAIGDGFLLTYPPAWAGRFRTIRGCLIEAPMEEILLRHQRFFLHASLVTSPWGGLLFTGDSGVGKSTQAELWQSHRGSVIINGDRALLAETGEGWQAYGSFYAGSSGYHVQRHEAVGAIVLLEQGQENGLRRVGGAEAFGRLFLQVSLDHRRGDLVDAVCDLLTRLLEAVPVYCLRCRPDVGAVETLEAALSRDRKVGEGVG